MNNHYARYNFAVPGFWILEYQFVLGRHRFPCQSVLLAKISVQDIATARCIWSGQSFHAPNTSRFYGSLADKI